MRGREALLISCFPLTLRSQLANRKANLHDSAQTQGKLDPLFQPIDNSSAPVLVAPADFHECNLLLRLLSFLPLSSPKVTERHAAIAPMLC